MITLDQLLAASIDNLLRLVQFEGLKLPQRKADESAASYKARVSTFLLRTWKRQGPGRTRPKRPRRGAAANRAAAG